MSGTNVYIGLLFARSCIMYLTPPKSSSDKFGCCAHVLRLSEAAMVHTGAWYYERMIAAVLQIGPSVQDCKQTRVGLRVGDPHNGYNQCCPNLFILLRAFWLAAAVFHGRVESEIY
ncbi:hypothetical protein BaRGS_00021975 [Batillaria attramentaria]|uniref:Uncharacterized protein n=1 Tax=Batillaria attramentaria TaxID=370345 RepID=A0ABD0KIK2_9CAEN